MTTFSDDFNRANGALGANWETPAGRGTISIVSNQVQGVTSPPLSVATVKATAAAFSADHEASLTLAVKSTFDYIGPAVRFDAASATGYYLRTDGINKAENRVYRFNGTTSTVCPGSTIYITGNAGDVFALRAEGTTLSVYRNGALLQSFTDTTYASGQPGMIYWRDNTGAARGDDFVATDVGSPSGPTPAAVDYYRRLCGLT